ncbi:winged helix-turn-helix transcriptional regulator [Chitinophaga arvensicola]|uniref:DNA-binding transcriptional regulator, HxlR family n=1 Tax=Chitinophaga arvensicola TaxID=29529 RepID=A0A1I0S8E8_9BACT|nr:helix-turn-helix domain-containing protein [Chitinophaga arvensicola]SEW52336.1 DNA-binding transcriptional regulator, HxlR family [Chitinophaga arvensicola]
MIKTKKEKNNERSAVYNLGSRTFDCPIELTSTAINGKWKLLIIYRLSLQHKLRFSQLKKEVKGVSEKMLIQHLKEMEKDGLVDRIVYPVVPPKVEYGLTEAGRSFIPVLDMMRNWGLSFIAVEATT